MRAAIVWVIYLVLRRVLELIVLAGQREATKDVNFWFCGTGGGVAPAGWPTRLEPANRVLLAALSRLILGLGGRCSW
jgi:hypothetical protein